MRIVFMGTPDFAVETLRLLAESGHEVAAVVTQPDKARGRSRMMRPSPVKEEAMKRCLTVYQPDKVRDPQFMRVLEELEPDVIVVAAYGQIIPEGILSLPRYGCLNIHASLLPKYRGAAPIQWAVIDGEKETGVTIMQMDQGLDTGDILSQAVVPVESDETGGSLFDKLSRRGAQLLLETLDALEEGVLSPVRQPEESPTRYASMLTKQMGCLDWRQDAGTLERLVRGLSPWPGAYTFLDHKMLKIWKAQDVPGVSEGAHGTVTAVDADGFTVACGGGALRILQLQIEGKKRMDAGAFLRGYTLTPGMRLTCERG